MSRCDLPRGISVGWELSRGQGGAPQQSFRYRGLARWPQPIGTSSSSLSGWDGAVACLNGGPSRPHRPCEGSFRGAGSPAPLKRLRFCHTPRCLLNTATARRCRARLRKLRRARRYARRLALYQRLPAHPGGC